MKIHSTILSSVFTLTNNLLGKLNYSGVAQLLQDNNLTEEHSVFVNGMMRMKTNFKDVVATISEMSNNDSKVFTMALMYSFFKEEFSREKPDINTSILPVVFTVEEISAMEPIFSMPEYTTLVDTANLEFLLGEAELVKFYTQTASSGYLPMTPLLNKIVSPSISGRLSYLPQYIVINKFNMSIGKPEAETIVYLIEKGVDVLEVIRPFNESPVSIKFNDPNNFIDTVLMLKKLKNEDVLVLETSNAIKASAILRKML